MSQKFITFMMVFPFLFGSVSQAEIKKVMPLSDEVRIEKLSSFSLHKPYSYTLQNGLRLIVYPDKRAKVTAHSIWYNVGAADEIAGESGLAHFFEHLMFKGTKKHPKDEYSQFIAQKGGEENAYTTNDYTVYYQNIPSEYLKKIMEFESDRMVNLHLTKDNFYSERDVVLEERSMRIDNEPTALLAEQMSAMLFRNHPYGSPTIGWRHEIANLEIDNALDFYKKYYAPNNAIVTVIGDVEPEKVLEYAIATYGKNPKNHDLTLYRRPKEPPQNIERFVKLKHENVSVPSLLYYAQSLQPDKENRNIYALAIGLKALGGGGNSYLYKKMVKQDRVALSVGAYASMESFDASQVILQAIPAKDVTLSQLELLLKDVLLKAISEKKLAKDDFLKSRQNIITDFISLSDSRGNMARFFGANLLRGASIDELVHLPKIIHSITDEEVYNALRAVFSPNNCVIGYLEKED